MSARDLYKHPSRIYKLRLRKSLISNSAGSTNICKVTFARDLNKYYIVYTKKSTSARVLLSIQEVFTRNTMSARDLFTRPSRVYKVSSARDPDKYLDRIFKSIAAIDLYRHPSRIY